MPETKVTPEVPDLKALAPYQRRIQALEAELKPYRDHGLVGDRLADLFRSLQEAGANAENARIVALLRAKAEEWGAQGVNFKGSAAHLNHGWEDAARELASLIEQGEAERG